MRVVYYRHLYHVSINCFCQKYFFKIKTPRDFLLTSEITILFKVENKPSFFNFKFYSYFDSYINPVVTFYFILLGCYICLCELLD